MIGKIKIAFFKSKITKKLKETLGFDDQCAKALTEDFHELFEKIVATYAKNNNLTEDVAQKKIMDLIQNDEDFKELSK